MGGGGGAGKGAMGATGAVGGCWLINIVPLNFGAAAPFKLKPHLVQVVACSVFCVPQFGQNTRKSSHEPALPPRSGEREAGGSVVEVGPGSKKNALHCVVPVTVAGISRSPVQAEDLDQEKKPFRSRHALTPTGVDH